MSDNFSLAFYSGNRKTGSISIIDRTDGQTVIDRIAIEPETDLDKTLKPVFVGLTEDRRLILLDPKTRQINIQEKFPEDAFPAHIYSDPYSSCDWFMNDGDKETGNDTLNCGNQGSSVTAIENAASSSVKYLATICVGRGHHQATFTAPSDQAPIVPRRAYISNLKDGTVSAIGNDPNDQANYLKVVATINLCEPDKEDGMDQASVPNNAFPHGLVFSPVSGKLYNLNNGYGDIAVIDPENNEIIEKVAFKGHSNLFVSPCGKYIIGRGADRKSDPDHVIAKLTVMDAVSHKILDSADLQDIYISKYFFNNEGTKLYLTTGSSGSPEQKANIKSDVVLVLDMTALPDIKLVKELKTGASGSLDFLVDGGETSLVFSSDSEKGALVIIDGKDDQIIETIDVAAGASHSRVWVL